ncbi:MAG: phage holin family protein [Cyanothece sp. SIO1E1]|nr:phage holin family protein [Cyanothece sp. SIO1E1]
MSSLVGIIVFWLVTTGSLLIISRLPLGVEIDSAKKAFIAAVVFGIVNGLLRPILSFLGAPITFLTFGLFSIVISAIIFGLSALIVEGFRLRWGIWSALLGGVALGVINSFIYQHVVSRILGF